MKKSIIALLIVAPLSLGLTGCVFKIGGENEAMFSSDFEDREYENRRKIARTVLSSSYVDVQRDMGVADFTETYTAGEKTIQVLYYRTHRIKKDGLTTKDECTYLHFVDGSLAQMGNGADYKRVEN